MLDDVIKSVDVCGMTISLLLYSIEPEFRKYEDGHKHYYEIRISFNNKNDDWETFGDCYTYLKKDALKEFTLAKKQAKKYAIEDAIREKELAEWSKPISVLDTITGHTFSFANSYDKESFFRAWDKLVVSVKRSHK
jgi:hypothetical protein